MNGLGLNNRKKESQTDSHIMTVLRTAIFSQLRKQCLLGSLRADIAAQDCKDLIMCAVPY